MKIIVECEPKEIAALALELQKRQRYGEIAIITMPRQQGVRTSIDIAQAVISGICHTSRCCSTSHDTDEDKQGRHCEKSPSPTERWPEKE